MSKMIVLRKKRRLKIMKKKILAFVLATVTAVGLFSGCGF